MGLTRLSITRPITMLMFIVAISVMGWRSLGLMQVERFPSVDFPFITVSVFFPGASPEDVEDLVLKPIEDAVVGISGVDDLNSVANEAVGFIVVAFNESVNGNEAAIEVERQVASIRNQLPDDAEAPSIAKFDFNAVPIMSLTISGPQSQDELAEIARDLIQLRLQSIKGVASVSVLGGREEIVSVQADPNLLAAYNLTLGQVQQAFSFNNLTFPVGNLNEGEVKSSVRSVGSFQTIAQIENMVVSGAPDGQGGGPAAPLGSDTGGFVYLRDVASVTRSREETTVLQRYNGQDTVTINITKVTDANTIEVADEVLAEIEKLNEDLPGGAQLAVINDDSQFTRNAVAAVQEDLILAILITGAFMLFFLHTIRSTFIVIIAIPVALVSTFTLMWAFGFTLNVLTLLALTLIIGILVDDSIVVVENTERHLRMGKTPKQAAFDGRKEIALAGISITLVDVIVYVPVAYTSGIIGRFFRSYGITIAVAALLSLFGAFTLAPLLAAYLMEDKTQEKPPRRGLGRVFGWIVAPINWAWLRFIRIWEAGFTALANAYAVVIRLTLANFFTQLLAFGGAVVALVLTAITLGPVVGFEFIPQEDDGKLRVSIEMPPGTDLAITDKVARQIEQTVLQEVPETVSILTNVGASAGGGFAAGSSDTNRATINITMVNKNDRERKINDVINDLRPKVSNIPDALVTIGASSGAGPGGSPIQIQLRGPDPDVLIDLANQVAEIVRTSPGTVDVVNNDAVLLPEVRIELDRERVTDLGLSPAIVATTLRTALVGSDVGDFDPEGQDSLKINLEIQEKSREDLNDLLQLPIGYMNDQPVLLGQVAEIVRGSAPSTINRADRERVLTVASSVTVSDVGGVSQQIEERIQSEIFFPPGFSYRFGGDVEQQRESFGQLGSALLLSFLLIYILLVGLYQNFLQPFAIMFSLPMSWIGVFFGLWLTNNTFNIFSILGLIMLTGLVSRNAILIIDFANQLQAEGLSRKEALIEAGRLRLRPIIMTAGTLIVALLPVLLSTADGSETRQPLAAVLMGGAVTSGLMTLFVVPVVYNFFEGLTSLILRIFRWIVGSPPSDQDQDPMIEEDPLPPAGLGSDQDAAQTA